MISKTVGIALLLLALPFTSAAQDEFQTPAASDTSLTAEQFSDTLKVVWSFLKEQTDAFAEATKERGEFESTADFNVRVQRERQALHKKIYDFNRTNRYNRRLFVVYAKARLMSYDADRNIYYAALDTPITAPYNIPNLSTVLTPNPVLTMRDDIINGYRTSSIAFAGGSVAWETQPSIAQSAKAAENQLYFKFGFVIDLRQGANVGTETKLTILTTSLELVNTSAWVSYWNRVFYEIPKARPARRR